LKRKASSSELNRRRTSSCNVAFVSRCGVRVDDLERDLASVRDELAVTAQ
jgi:hypothetical protein